MLSNYQRHCMTLAVTEYLFELLEFFSLLSKKNLLVSAKGTFLKNRHSSVRWNDDLSVSGIKL